MKSETKGPEVGSIDARVDIDIRFTSEEAFNACIMNGAICLQYTQGVPEVLGVNTYDLAPMFLVPWAHFGNLKMLSAVAGRTSPSMIQLEAGGQVSHTLCEEHMASNGMMVQRIWCDSPLIGLQSLLGSLQALYIL